MAPVGIHADARRRWETPGAQARSRGFVRVSGLFGFATQMSRKARDAAPLILDGLVMIAAP
jgi:hypothetical protein